MARPDSLSCSEVSPFSGEPLEVRHRIDRFATAPLAAGLSTLVSWLRVLGARDIDPGGAGSDPRSHLRLSSPQENQAVGPSNSRSCASSRWHCARLCRARCLSALLPVHPSLSANWSTFLRWAEPPLEPQAVTDSAAVPLAPQRILSFADSDSDSDCYSSPQACRRSRTRRFTPRSARLPSCLSPLGILPGRALLPLASNMIVRTRR